MDDGIQRGAAVHHLDYLGHQRLERRSNFAKHHGDAFFAHNRQAVRRQQQLGPHRHHAPQSAGPVGGIALHFLRVASIRKIPDDEVASHDPLLLRKPRPQVVVGFTAVVKHLDVFVTNHERQ